MNLQIFKITGIICCLTFLLNHILYGQSELLVRNFNHHYDPKAEIHLRHRTVNLENRSLLYLELTIRHIRTQIKDLSVTYAFLDRYSGNLDFSKDTIALSDQWINNTGIQHYFHLEINNPDNHKILILKIYNQLTQNEFYFDIPIDPEAQVLNHGILLKLSDQNIPYFKNYIESTVEFGIENYTTKDSIHYIYRYSNNFPVAVPPFSSNGESVNKEMEIDSSFMLTTGKKIRLKNPGLYFIQHDTTGANGLAFRIEDKFFPRRTTYSDLIESLKYLATNSEINRLNSTGDKKRAFEEYWLDVTNSPERAKKVIRDYYGRISDANEFFTNYKQGWKTDKGMIFVIFGPPDVVTKDGKMEIWVYERNSELPRISFEFQNIQNIFTHDHFVLVRKRSYQQIWYKAIDLWRKGQKDI